MTNDWQHICAVCGAEFRSVRQLVLHVSDLDHFTPEQTNKTKEMVRRLFDEPDEKAMT